MTDFSWHRRAQNCIAQSYLTNSKRPETFVKGIYPTHVTKGQGCYLWDTTGKRYMDFVCGLGTNLLGYGNDRINQAIIQGLRGGYSHSLATHHEVEAAEKLKELVPFVDCVKFLKTGSEACSAAVRIARAATGRDAILSEGYHGWSDEFVSLTPPSYGVPEITDDIGHCIRPIHRLDLTRIHPLLNVAAVIIEPVITDTSPERRKWLQKLRDDCTKAGALLIFDEVITGFRFPKYSITSWCGVTPDLIVLGKGIANGMPLAAVGGKYAVMNCGEYFVSSTYAGDALSLIAAKTSMTLLQTKYDLNWLWERGQVFLDEFNTLWPEKLTIEGYPTRGAFKGDPEIKALFWQEACKAGLLFGPSWFFNFPLAEEVKNVMGTIRAIMRNVKEGQVRLEGEMPQSPFAQRVREQ